MGPGPVAHGPWDLDGDRDTDLLGDLPGVLDRPLAMSISSTMSSMDNMRVMADDTGAVVNLLVDLVALLGHNILALLDVGGVHNSVVLGVTLSVLLSVAGGVCGRVVDSGAHSLAIVIVATM